MDTNDSPRPRWRTEEQGQTLTITIPICTHWKFILLLALVLCVWMLGGYKFVAELIIYLAGSVPAALTTPVVVAIWTILTVYAVYDLLWEIEGREIIRIDGKALTIKRGVWGLGRTRLFSLNEIRHLRFYPWEERPLVAFRYLYWRQLRSRRAWKSLAFDYGSRTCHFGIDLDEQEAKGLLKAITERFPDISTF